MDDFVSSVLTQFSGGDTQSDPTADFLAREAAILGDDAALFATENDQVAPVTTSTTFDASGFDAFAAAPSAVQQPFSAGSQAPSIPLTSPGTFSQPPVAFTSTIPPPEPEPEVEPDVIRAWRQEFEATISTRDSKSNEKHEKILKTAKEQLERFYAEYNDKKEKAIKKLKAAETADKSPVESSNFWENVARHIDLNANSNQLSSRDQKLRDKLAQKNPDDKKDKKMMAVPANAAAEKKAKDTTRMKKLLVDLKKNGQSPAPK